MARYSTSALDLKTVSYHFDDQDIKLSPRKTQKPEVERRVSGQPAQSTSEYAKGDVEAEVQGALEITNDVFDEVIMGGEWGMHEEAGLLNGIGQIRTSESHVLGGTAAAVGEAGGTAAAVAGRTPTGAAAEESHQRGSRKQVGGSAAGRRKPCALADAGQGGPGADVVAAVAAWGRRTHAQSRG